MPRALRTLALAAGLLASPASAAVSDPWTAIAEVRAFATEAGDAIWPGYGTAPFGILLIEAEQETLACQAAPDGFKAQGRMPTTGCEHFTRAVGRLPASLLAAMPLFGPPSTIVVGTTDSTGLSPGAWKRTLLHEHFHQWQANLPGYYDRVAALDLAGGDQTGMWMLNFAFPYADPAAVAAHRRAFLALASALEARGRPQFGEAFRIYMEARSAFRAAVGEHAWRYAELQLWQEGVGRWTEIVLGLRYPDEDVRATAAELEQHTLAQLARPDLDEAKRQFAYAHGAGEAMLLEACNSKWREDYSRTLALGGLLEDAVSRCT